MLREPLAVREPAFLSRPRCLRDARRMVCHAKRQRRWAESTPSRYAIRRSDPALGLYCAAPLLPTESRPRSELARGELARRGNDVRDPQAGAPGLVMARVSWAARTSEGLSQALASGR